MPASFNNTVQRKDAQKWREAMEFEFRTLTNLNTWKLVKPPGGRELKQAKFVFDLEHDGSSSVTQ